MFYENDRVEICFALLCMIKCSHNSIKTCIAVALASVIARAFDTLVLPFGKQLPKSDSFSVTEVFNSVLEIEEVDRRLVRDLDFRLF